MDKYLTKSNPFESAKKKKRTFSDYNDDSDIENMEVPAESPMKKRKINDTDMKVSEDESAGDESDSDYQPANDNRSPVESVKSLKAKLRRMEASLLKLDAENKRLKEENKKLKSKAFKDRLTPAKSSGRRGINSPVSMSLIIICISIQNNPKTNISPSLYYRENDGRNQQNEEEIPQEMGDSITQIGSDEKD